MRDLLLGRFIVFASVGETIPPHNSELLLVIMVCLLRESNSMRETAALCSLSTLGLVK